MFDVVSYIYKLALSFIFWKVKGERVWIQESYYN